MQPLFNLISTFVAFALINSAVQVSGQDNWRDGNDGSVPCSNAIIGGYEGGKPVYIVRASTGVGLLPGKLVSRIGQAFVPFNDREIRVYNYQVLCASGTQYSWQEYDGPLTNEGNNWVVGGRSGAGDTLYICKVRAYSQDIIGKFHQRHNKCFYPYGGSEYDTSSFDLLLRS